VLEHGTGALNVDGCRVGMGDEYDPAKMQRQQRSDGSVQFGSAGLIGKEIAPYKPGGRWPANLIHDGSEEVVAGFPAQRKSSGGAAFSKAGYGGGWCPPDDAAREIGYGDSGSAARFFKRCEPDATCPLCCLPYAEAFNTMQAWKNTLASIAEKRGWTSQATSEFIARVSAIGPASERIAPHVKSAGNLCDSCAISIAVALVATKTSAFSSEELLATLASTGNYNASILIPSLACFAELWESIDIIPTTNSLSLLFGSVRDAIANFINKDTVARAGPRCEPSRFAYVPKASKADRDEGCEGLEEHRGGSLNIRTDGHSQANGMDTGPRRNHHPTVKPTALMRYLCRLVTPPGGIVLDPFMGSGSTGKGAVLEGFRFIGIEMEAEYVEIAVRRVAQGLLPLGGAQ
jgi:hypothetical protein